MTVIAWDGTTLAADKRAIAGGSIVRTCTKIRRITYSEPGWTKPLPALLAITGCWDTGAEMREWWIAGADPAAFPPKAREDKATLIVIRKHGRIDTFGIGPLPMAIEAERCAWGSGRDYAEAAMYLGHPAEKAVRVACEFQSEDRKSTRLNSSH